MPDIPRYDFLYIKNDIFTRIRTYKDNKQKDVKN